MSLEKQLIIFVILLPTKSFLKSSQEIVVKLIWKGKVRFGEIESSTTCDREKLSAVAEETGKVFLKCVNRDEIWRGVWKYHILSLKAQCNALRSCSGSPVAKTSQLIQVRSNLWRYWTCSHSLWRCAENERLFEICLRVSLTSYLVGPKENQQQQQQQQPRPHLHAATMSHAAGTALHTMRGGPHHLLNRRRIDRATGGLRRYDTGRSTRSTPQSRLATRTLDAPLVEPPSRPVSSAFQCAHPVVISYVATSLLRGYRASWN